MELNQIIHADCLDIIKDFPDGYFDLCLTDPPYGINRDKGFGGFEGFGGFGKPIKRTEYKGDWDSVKIEKIYFDEMIRVSKTAIIFGGNFYTDCLPQNNFWVVWDKRNTMPTFGDCELAWTNINRNSVKKYEVEFNGLLGKEKERIHATQKPLKLFKKIINDFSNENDLIIDCFSGSATTAVACIDLNRNYLCIEKDKDYFEASVKRINKELLKIKMF